MFGNAAKLICVPKGRTVTLSLICDWARGNSVPGNEDRGDQSRVACSRAFSENQYAIDGLNGTFPQSVGV